MLSRHFRIVVGFVAATMVLMLLAHQHLYDFSRYTVTGSHPQSNSQGATDTKQAPTTVADEKDQSSGEKSEQLKPPADPTIQEPALPESPTPIAEPGSDVPFLSSVGWSRFAYVQYVTNTEYFCNAAMAFESLHRLGSKAERVLLYPESMLDDPDIEQSADGRSRELLKKVQGEYNVKLVPIEIQHRDDEEETWVDSYTKLLAFNQTQYDRVIAFDSDALVLQAMDELFFMPPCPVALPRAYWLMNDKPPKKILATHLMVLQPSRTEFSRLQRLVGSAKAGEFDMEIVNKLYLDSAAVIPHRPYALLTAEFRQKDHTAYLGSDVEEWDPRAVLDEAKLAHFSDWPVQKPWLDVLDEEGLRREHQPECRGGKTDHHDPDGGEEKRDCRDREIWNALYAEFRNRRENVCGRW